MNLLQRVRLWRLPRRVLMAGVRGYQLLLGAWLRPACRFEPSCSAYALISLDRHGALAGSYLATMRLLRCHPWCEPGADPVPACPPAFFTRFIASSPTEKTVP